MTLNELIKELQEWQELGLGELSVFFRNIQCDSDFDIALDNCELTQIDNKLIFL